MTRVNGRTDQVKGKWLTTGINGVIRFRLVVSLTNVTDTKRLLVEKIYKFIVTG